MKWQSYSISEFADVRGGKRLPAGHDFVSEPTNHLYIRARDIGAGKIEINEPVYITEDTFEKISRYTVDEGDLVLTIVGANIGDAAYIPSIYAGANLTENAAKISVDRSKCAPKYLKYCLSNDNAKKAFSHIAIGAAQGKLGLYKINDFKIALPKLAIQTRIAEILSTYDELIENNRCQIKLLEESARLLYREWFERLRFPGHDQLKLVNEVPEGWKKTQLRNIAVLNYGKALKSDERIEGNYFVYGSSGIVGTNVKPLIAGPGIIIGRKGNVGSIFWESKPFWPIDTVYYISDEPDLFLFYALKTLHFISTDVAVPGLNRIFNVELLDQGEDYWNVLP